MIFTQTDIPGVFLIDIDPKSDDRGFLARTFCADEFAAHGLKPVVAQANLSFNLKKGTLRGMHLQVPPKPETKVIRCIRGSIYDVVVDIRPESPTYLRHVSFELSAESRRAIYVPEGLIHGFQTLEDTTEVYYLMGEFYTPGLYVGFRYDDPAFNLHWPLPVSAISDRDLAWPAYPIAK